MSETKRLMLIYKDIDEFERLLMDACEAASTETQVEFVHDFLDKFQKAGGYMLITDKQHEALKELAERDNDEFSTTSH